MTVMTLYKIPKPNTLTPFHHKLYYIFSIYNKHYYYDYLFLISSAENVFQSENVLLMMMHM